MGASVEDICLWVDKPASKVKEALEGQECDCPACRLRRKMESGNASPEDMIEFLKALKQHMEEREGDE